MGKNRKAESTTSLNTGGLRILGRIISRRLLGICPYDEEHLVESGENPNESGHSVTNRRKNEHKSQIRARKKDNENLPQRARNKDPRRCG